MEGRFRGSTSHNETGEITAWDECYIKCSPHPHLPGQLMLNGYGVSMYRNEPVFFLLMGIVDGATAEFGGKLNKASVIKRHLDRYQNRVDYRFSLDVQEKVITIEGPYSKGSLAWVAPLAPDSASASASE
jgi:hypothetical protein